MIGYLRGLVLEVGEETVLFDVNGVGYEVVCPSPVLQDLSLHRGALKELWIYTHLREDALVLFGFLHSEEKSFFLTLLKVNGVGPKLAISILGGASPEKIQGMVETEDVKGLTQLPKVGKKTAEQMILTLKGKLVLSAKTNAVGPSKILANRQLITSALVNLGYKIQDIERVLNDFPGDLDVQDGVRKGLHALAKPL